MPRIMFQEVVCPDAGANRRWYTLPVSFLAHTIVLGVLIVVPLIATDVLPRPKAMLEYVLPTMPATMVAQPPPMRQPQVARPEFMMTPGAPTEAPHGIAPETALTIDREPVAGVEGVIEGLGGPGIGIIETSPPPLRKEEQQPIRISRGIQAPTRIKDVAPEYPEIARRARVQGVVILEAVIGTDGRVERARVLRSVPLLDQAALNAVQSWEYTPTLLDGRPVPIIMTVTVNFKLE